MTRHCARGLQRPAERWADGRTDRVSKVARLSVTDDYEGISEVLIEQFETTRLPRILAIEERLDQRENLGNLDFGRETRLAGSRKNDFPFYRPIHPV